MVNMQALILDRYNGPLEPSEVPRPKPTDGQVLVRIAASGAIALLAYFYWEARGCPHHSPHEDWFRAEAELHNGRDGAAID